MGKKHKNEVFFAKLSFLSKVQTLISQAVGQTNF